MPLRVSPVADFPSEYLKDMTALLEAKGMQYNFGQRTFSIS